MRVLVAGATGVLGRRVVRLLAEHGHDAVGLSRSSEGDRVVKDAGGEPVRGDLFEPSSLDAACRNADAVVHAATAIPTSEKPTRDEWATNDRVRREGTRNLVQAALSADVPHVVFQSIVWAVGNDTDHYDEDAPPRPTPLTRSVLDAEDILATVADDTGLDVAVLRFGVFYAPDSAHTRGMAEQLAAGKFPVIGRGLTGTRDAVVAPLHVDDAASAIVAALESSATGTFHVVDDETVRLGELMRTFADLIGAPEPGRVPAWIARFVAGRDAVDYLTTSMRTDSARFKAATDWVPQYPTVREGLEDVVGAWQREGFRPGGARPPTL